MTISTNRESDRFMLRLPDGMRDRLKAEAAHNGRSMNAEIIHRLEETLKMDDYAPEKNVRAGDEMPSDLSELVDMIQRSSAYIQKVERRLNQLIGVGDRFGYVKQKHYFVPHDDEDEK